MHAQHPFHAIWDDHECEDNYAGKHEGDPLRPRRVSFEERKRAGYLAYFEYLPVPRLREDPFRIYGSHRIGQAELLLIDARQYRDALACQPTTPCPEGEAAGRSILGAAQRDWLKGALTGSTAPWKVVLNGVMMMSLDIPAPGVTINADQWDGYAAERREILEHVLARGTKDVTVLSGDIHTFFAGTVTTTGRVTGQPAATEFVGGSITTNGLAESFPGVDPAALAATIKADNPHITYAELKSRGYGVLEARPDELRVTYRSPGTVHEPRSEMRDLARFRVARGATTVETV
jgi:alkaline phosphatase D